MPENAATRTTAISIQTMIDLFFLALNLFFSPNASRMLKSKQKKGN